jgi:hypothetical protein
MGETVDVRTHLVEIVVEGQALLRVLPTAGRDRLRELAETLAGHACAVAEATADPGVVIYRPPPPRTVPISRRSARNGGIQR